MKKILNIITLLIVGFGLISCDNGTFTTDHITINTFTENQTIITTTTEADTMITTTESDTIITTTTEKETTTTAETTTTDGTTTTEDNSDRYVNIDLYSMNDFHGGAYSEIEALSYVGSYVKQNQANSIYLTNGDMLQGSAISNYYYGMPIVDSLNEAGFDGFVIGNHEFDWGIDKVLEYRDGHLENGELNHEILAANIVYEDTGLPLENTEPYIIKSFSGVDIGVIGLIGELKNSISASRTENIEFLDPVVTAGRYARELRNNHDVEIVVVYIHNGSSINQEIANLSGDERIDGVFNGHRHWNETGEIVRDSLKMPYAQANNYDTWMVSINFVYDLQTDSIDSFSTNKYYESYFRNQYQTNSEIDNLLSTYQNDTAYLNFINEELTYAEGYYEDTDLTEWGASVIRDYANVDVGAVNSGGFRVTMDAGTLTMGEMMTIYPFDNVIKTSRMTGQQILDFYNEVDYYNSDVVFDDGLVPVLDNDGNVITLEINGVPIVLDQFYTVGAVDFIFDQSNYDFIEGEDITITTYYMRDLLVQDLRNSNGSFNPYDGTNIN